jgi:hypothetical protein
MTMIVGASFYVLYLVQIQILNDALFYTVSALLGLGAALLWTAQVHSYSRKNRLSA